MSEWCPRIWYAIYMQLWEQVVEARWPDTSEKRASAAAQMQAKGALTGCIGAIDCTHVPIWSPDRDQANPVVYRNRDGYSSFNVQVRRSGVADGGAGEG
ncbi:MAG: hypothetical protein WC718_18985 [Phycisphaerales bacterium]